MSQNQHIATITIIWPDDKWDLPDEVDYIHSALAGVEEQLRRHPIANDTVHREFFNRLGRKFAELEISKAEPVPRCKICDKPFNKYWHYVENGDGHDEPYPMNMCFGCYEVIHDDEVVS